LRETKFIESLQVEPEFRAGSKKMGEAQRRVASNGALPVHNLRDSVRGHVEFARKSRSAHAERLKLFG